MTAPNFLDLTDQRFGRLIAKESIRKDGIAWWRCVCDCGTERIVRSQPLRLGMTKSCGCLRRELGGHSFKNKKHGMINTPEYRSWRAMRSRCLNRRDKDFRNYGGRGIRICKRWDHFENFLADMGLRPAGLTLDRKNNEGNYTPANCRWATRSEQQRNKRPFHWRKNRVHG